jgi:hypothetical protein
MRINSSQLTTIGFKSPRLRVSVTYPVVLIVQAISKLLGQISGVSSMHQKKEKSFINIHMPTGLRYSPKHVYHSVLDFYLGEH